MIFVRSVGKPNVSYIVNTLVPGYVARRLPQLVELAFEPLEATRERRAEPRLFFERDACWITAAPLAQLGIRSRHHVDHLVADVGHERLVEPEVLLAVTHRAPEDPAQRVLALALVGKHAVGDEERAAPRVVGDHAHRGVASSRSVAVLLVRDLGDALR